MNVTTSNQELLTRFRRSERAAFRWFYDRHAVALFTFLTHLTGDTAAAEDAMQELFLQIARKPEPFIAADNFAVFLYAAARNVALQKLRAARRQKQALERAARMWQLNAQPESSMAAEDAKLLQDGLQRLPELERVIVLLHIYEDISFSDMQPLLKISKSTAHERYQNALAQMAKQWR